MLFFLATVVTVAIGTLVVKPTYEATSQILVKIGRENLYVPTVPASSNLNPVISFNREEQINSEIEILTSLSLLEEVVVSLGPTTIYKGLSDEGRGILRQSRAEDHVRQTAVDKALLKFQKALTVEGVKKSNVIDISLKHTDPHMAATAVNKLVKLYLDHHLDVHKTPQSYKFFLEQSQALNSELKRAEENLEAFKKQHNVTSLNEERSLLLKQGADLRAGLNQTLSQQAETENRTRQLKHQLVSTPKTIPQGEETGSSPYVINTLQARLVELDLKEKGLLTKYTEQNRLVQNVREEIQIVRHRLAEQEAKRYETIRSGVNVTYQRLQEELFRNQAQLKALKAKKETQQAQLADYQRSTEKLNQIEVELNQLQQQVDVDRENYRLYLTKFEESRISDAMDTEKIANVTQIQPARPPLKPVSPKVLRNMVLAVFMGAFGALGLALFMEYLDDSLERPEDARHYLQMSVVASIPEFEHRFVKENINDLNWCPLSVAKQTPPSIPLLPRASVKARFSNRPINRSDSVEEVKSRDRPMSHKHFDNQQTAGMKVEAEKEKPTPNPENNSPGKAPESNDENAKTAKLVIQMGALGNGQLPKI